MAITLRIVTPCFCAAGVWLMVGEMGLALIIIITNWIPNTCFPSIAYLDYYGRVKSCSVILRLGYYGPCEEILESCQFHPRSSVQVAWSLASAWSSESNGCLMSINLNSTAIIDDYHIIIVIMKVPGWIICHCIFIINNDHYNHLEERFLGAVVSRPGGGEVRRSLHCGQDVLGKQLKRENSWL